MRGQSRSDRISNLPDNIVENILSHLPIRDAVRTSLLATTWRYRWTSLLSLVFDHRSFPDYDEDNVELEIANIIDHVLFLHLSPIQKFKLTCNMSLPERNIDRWILHLSRSTIKELILEFKYLLRPEYIKAPSCLFSCQSLTQLKLSCCVVTLPSWFKGFPNLKFLSLSVDISNVEYQKLIDSCPVLESLALSHPYYFDGLRLNIDAPYLQSLELGGNVTDVTLQNTPRLAEVVSKDTNFDRPISFLKSLANLSKLRTLEFEGDFIERLCTSDLPTEMPQFSANIQSFSAEVYFFPPERMLVTVNVLQGMPNLEELNVSSAYSEDDAQCLKFNDQNYSFSKLRCITD